MITAFCEGLEAAGHEWDVYDVCKMNIHGCLACEYCHTKGNGQCIQKDDMQVGVPEDRILRSEDDLMHFLCD